MPATINHTWGYRKDDHDWKSMGDIVFKLVDIVSKGGNYLLNVGPMANGVIPQPSADVLRHAGAWLKVNGEAIYGAGPTPFGDELGEPSARGTKDVRGQPLVLPHNEYRYTTKPGKLFITFFASRACRSRCRRCRTRSSARIASPTARRWRFARRTASASSCSRDSPTIRWPRWWCSSSTASPFGSSAHSLHREPSC